MLKQAEEEAEEEDSRSRSTSWQWLRPWRATRHPARRRLPSWSRWETTYYPQLRVPWFPVFGNHDYGGGASAVRAQIERYRENVDEGLWVFPSTNYTRRFDIPGKQGGSVAIVFVDTTTLAPSQNKCCNEKG